MPPPILLPLLLFPPHLAPSTSTLPFFTALQSLLNIAYTAKYCTRPDVWGTSHLRLTDPSKFIDIIGADGFTVIILALKSELPQQHHRSDTSAGDDDDDSLDLENDKELVAEIVATGSVKAFDDEAIRIRAQQHWTSPAEQAAGSDNRIATTGSNSISTTSEELDGKLQALHDERQHPPRVYELQALAVSPAHQRLGLGGRVLKLIEWLLGTDGDQVLNFAKGFDEGSALFVEARLVVSSSSASQRGVEGRVKGIDLDKLKNVFERIMRLDGDAGSETKQLERNDAHGVGVPSLSRLGRRRLVLIAIRELGNEDYYLRRGFKSVGTAMLPLGTWGNKAECTMVYMEKSI